MSKKILMEALAKFQRRQPDIGDHALNEVAEDAKQASRFARSVAMVSVKAKIGGKFLAANSASVVLPFERFPDHLRAHSGFLQSLIIGASLAKTGICRVATVLSFSRFLFDRILLAPYFAMRLNLSGVVVLRPILFPFLGMFGSVSGNSKPIQLPRSFWIGHDAHFSMTVGEVN